MREILDAILSFIGAESLTDLEFDSITIEDETSDTEAYNALLTILTDRDSVSDFPSRLRYYYLAKGVSFSEASTETPRSNILLGSEL